MKWPWSRHIWHDRPGASDSGCFILLPVRVNEDLPRRSGRVNARVLVLVHHLVKVALWTWHLVSRKWLTPPPWDHPPRRRRSKPQTCKPRRRRSGGRWSPSCRRSSLWSRCQHGCTCQPALALPLKEQLDLIARKYFKPVQWDQLTQKKPLDSKFGLEWEN